MSVTHHLVNPGERYADRLGDLGQRQYLERPVEDILGGAGFNDVSIEPLRQALFIGGADLDAAIDFLMRMGPTARALREAADPSLTGRVAAAVKEALAPFHTPDGIKMDSAAWIVTATA